MDGTDVSISGCVVTTDMCSSLRKRADPEAGPSFLPRLGATQHVLPMVHLDSRIHTSCRNV